MDKFLPLVVALAALGLFAALSAPAGGFRFAGVVMSAGEGGITVSADEIVLSGTMMAENGWVRMEISRMSAGSFTLAKVDENGVLEIKARRAEATNTVMLVRIEDVGDSGIGFFLHRLAEENRGEKLTITNLCIEGLELPAEHVSTRDIVFEGMKLHLSPASR